MLCCICKERDATVHLTQDVIGKNEIRSMDLCKECAEKKGVNDATGFSLAELMQELATTISHQTPVD